MEVKQFLYRFGQALRVWTGPEGFRRLRFPDFIAIVANVMHTFCHIF